MNQLCSIEIKHQFLKIMILQTLIFFTVGCVSRGFTSHEAYSILNKKKYTPSEIETINHNFSANSEKYSQEFGDLVIWLIFQKNNEFAIKLSEIPELKDNINIEEAKALNRIHEIIKHDIKKDAYVSKIQSHGLASLHDFFLFTMTSDDVDLIKAYQNDIYKRKDQKMNDIAQFSPQLAGELKKVPEVIKGDEWYIVEALEDILYLKEISNQNNIKNLNDYFRVGIPKHRKFCTPVQALVWLAIDGEFNKANNPLNYSWYKLVKKAWGNMDGLRWDDPADASQRMNHPMLTNYWLRKKTSYIRSGSSHFEEFYRRKSGHCRAFANTGIHTLGPSGWNVGLFYVYWGGLRSPGHFVCILELNSEDLDPNIIYGFFNYHKIRKRLDETKKPLYWIIADGGGSREGSKIEPINGPYKSLKSVANSIVWAFGGTLIDYYYH